MIKVNLLGRKKKKKLKAIHIELFAFVLAVCAVIAAVVVVDMTMKAKTAFLEEQVNKKQRELKQLQRVKRDVDKFQKQMAELQKKIDIVRSLKEGQKGYYKILTNIEHSLPEDVWLSKLNYSGASVTLNCSSLRVASVNNFVMNLYETGMFTNIDLNKADKDTKDNVEVNNFVIAAGVRLD
ncbi:PilN domain-containing protein [Limisalsivibrio acetivorans]|uniref:PilN domain-containing protein n=1 Tax=Limisalsivibrio acetivorans TaxID=1304888 RepID=UPI0003B61AD7|nr:PilN domain-containing protein [Limisalsivibrio acetivorans]